MIQTLEIENFIENFASTEIFLPRRVFIRASVGFTEEHKAGLIFTSRDSVVAIVLTLWVCVCVCVSPVVITSIVAVPATEVVLCTLPGVYMSVCGQSCQRDNFTSVQDVVTNLRRCVGEN